MIGLLTTMRGADAVFSAGQSVNKLETIAL